MKGPQTKDIIVYEQNYQNYAKEAVRRVSIAEFKTIDAKRINKQFVILQNSYTPNEKAVFHYGQKGKDRYSNIHTYKHNRIQIEQIHNFYINASFMRSVIDNEIYAMFAQAPLKKVIEHFWYACYHFNIKKIIMLCSFEDPMRGIQAERYWPSVNEQLKLQSVSMSVRTIKEEKVDTDYIKTTICLKGVEGQKMLDHTHWTGWGDMKKPIGEKGEQLFQGLVRECIDSIEKKEMLLIHCSAGIGRTGTLGTMIEALRTAQKTKELSVFEIVDNMRRYRMGCVQTFEQYVFIYQQLQKML